MTWRHPLSFRGLEQGRTAEPLASQRAVRARLRYMAPQWTAGLLVLVGLLGAVATAGDYGVAWDDSVQVRYGAAVLDYFLSGGADRRCNELLDLRLYGPPVELLSAALGRIAPARQLELRHLVTALIALLSVPALYQFGRLLGHRYLGLLAAVALWTLPRFYGHAFVNTKDVPFAVGMIASLAALSALLARRKYTWREFMVCGLLMGCTVSVRPGGWLLLGPYYVLGVMFSDWQARRARRRPGSAQPRRRSLRKQAGMFAVAWIVMVACWPWAHESPLSHPLQAIRMSSQFHIVVPILFDGQVLMSDALPRTYLLRFLLLTTPAAVLIPALCGVVVAAVRLVRGLDHRRAVVYWMLLVWLALPLALFVVMRPNAYDGLRHFLFVLPALALFAAVGWHWCWTRSSRRLVRGAVAAVAVVAFCLPCLEIVRLHPYQIAYFNQLVGGVAGASGRYETEYWLTSYREAMEWIVRQPRTANAKVRVLVAANENARWCAAYYADPQIEVVTTLRGQQPGPLPDSIDYYLGTTRTGMSDNFPSAPIVYQVSRAGAVFAVVKGRGSGLPSFAGSTAAETALAEPVAP